jgi:hypothetical protein
MFWTAEFLCAWSCNSRYVCRVFKFHLLIATWRTLQGKVLRLGSFTGQFLGNINIRHSHYYVLPKAICKRAGVNNKQKLTGEQYILCMICLHCYHEFRVGCPRKSTEMNCKMEIIEMRGILFYTAETFLRNLSCSGVTYHYWHVSELINRRRSLNHADCQLRVTSSQSENRELHTFSCIVTVWHRLLTALYVALYTHTHTHTKWPNKIKKLVHDQ